MDLNSIAGLLIDLIKSMSVIIVLAYVLSRTKIYSELLEKKIINFKQKTCLAIVFGIFSIYGTLSGIDILGAIANTRDLGPAIAGLIGGPWIGMGAGLIGAVHRYSLAGITVVPCSIATVLAGLAGGFIYNHQKGKLLSVKGAVVFMALFEAFHMGLALLLIKPFDQALIIVENVSLPMICTNALGMGVFVFIIHNLIDEKETRRQKELIESELTVAREIQMSIVPKTFPPFPERLEFDIYAVLEPAREVGGDLYDFFFLDHDRLCFTIGDVSGKGVPASLFMAVTRTLIKARANINMNPDEILYAVNNELCHDNDTSMFVTQFLGILEISSGEIRYSTGGHNLPYVISKDGTVDVLSRTEGMALGVMEDVPYRHARVKLNSGDSLFLYTDGVTEAMNEEGELLGESRLEKFLEELSGFTAEEQVEYVLNATRKFADGASQSDDITIVVLQFLGG